MEPGHHKTAIITGGTRGIGKAIALTLAKQHYNLVLSYLSDTYQAQETLKACQEIHPNVLLFQADVSQRTSIQALMHETHIAFHSLDILINNAGINRDKALQEMTDDDWDRVIDTNMKGVFICSQVAAPYMLQQEEGGVIINIGASTGLWGRKNGLNYCASKAGVMVMTKCLALELAPKIRVNCIIPGSIWTEETEKRYGYNDPERRHVKEEVIPLKRLGTPQDVADAITFLLSSQALFVNGQKLIIDGGQYMW